MFNFLKRSPISKMNEETRLLVKKLKQKFNETPKIKYQLGVPINLKDDHLKNEVKYLVGKQRPLIVNFGSSLVEEGISNVSSIEIECDLILKLIAPWGGNKENSWAYLASGSTEGNLAGFKFGTKAFAEARPILLYSSEAHYSVPKAMDLTKEKFQACLRIPTLSNGEMDYEQIIPALRSVVSHKASPQDLPPVVVIATLGTTIKGANDNISLILDTLYSFGLNREKIYVHVDAAFHGGFWHLDKDTPKYQLGEELNSLTISGGKWYGADVSALFVLYNQDTIYNHEGYQEVLNTHDICLSGGRDGFHAISWLVRYVQFDWQKEYDMCQKNVKYVEKKFQDLGIETLNNESSLTICTPVLPQSILESYTMLCYTDAQLGKISHIIICPHVTEELLNKFFKGLQSEIDAMEKSFNSIL